MLAALSRHKRCLAEGVKVTGQCLPEALSIGLALDRYHYAVLWRIGLHAHTVGRSKPRTDDKQEKIKVYNAPDRRPNAISVGPAFDRHH